MAEAAGTGGGEPIVTDLAEQSNFYNADEQLKLSPAEKHLYKHHLGNLHMGGVHNDDGTTSTALAKTFGFGDRTYLIPTVWDNKIVGDDEAVRRAQKQGVDYFPSYKTREEAFSRYMDMHKFMDGDIR